MRPKNNCFYRCPYDVFPRPQTMPKSEISRGDVSGRWCKNNCPLYKKGCKKWQ